MSNEEKLVPGDSIKRAGSPLPSPATKRLATGLATDTQSSIMSSPDDNQVKTQHNNEASPTTPKTMYAMPISNLDAPTPQNPVRSTPPTFGPVTPVHISPITPTEAPTPRNLSHSESSIYEVQAESVAHSPTPARTPFLADTSADDGDDGLTDEERILRIRSPSNTLRIPHSFTREYDDVMATTLADVNVRNHLESRDVCDLVFKGCVPRSSHYDASGTAQYCIQIAEFKDSALADALEENSFLKEEVRVAQEEARVAKKENDEKDLIIAELREMSLYGDSEYKPSSSKGRSSKKPSKPSAKREQQAASDLSGAIDAVNLTDVQVSAVTNTFVPASGAVAVPKKATLPAVTLTVPSFGRPEGKVYNLSVIGLTIRKAGLEFNITEHSITDNAQQQVASPSTAEFARIRRLSLANASTSGKEKFAKIAEHTRGSYQMVARLPGSYQSWSPINSAENLTTWLSRLPPLYQGQAPLSGQYGSLYCYVFFRTHKSPAEAWVKQHHGIADTAQAEIPESGNVVELGEASASAHKDG